MSPRCYRMHWIGSGAEPRQRSGTMNDFIPHFLLSSSSSVTDPVFRSRPRRIIYRRVAAAPHRPRRVLRRQPFRSVRTYPTGPSGCGQSFREFGSPVVPASRLTRCNLTSRNTGSHRCSHFINFPMNIVHACLNDRGVTRLQLANWMSKLGAFRRLRF